MPELLVDPGDPEKYKRNLLKVGVFYEELSFKSIVERPAFTVSDRHFSL